MGEIRRTSEYHLHSSDRRSLQVNSLCPGGANTIKTAEPPKQNQPTGGGDLYLKLATKKDLSDRYEENHCKADPDTSRATASKAEIWTDARKHQLLSSHLQNILDMTTKAG